MRSNSTTLLLLLLKLSILLILFTQWCCSNENFISKSKSTTASLTTHLQQSEEKHKGTHLFGYIDSTNLQPFVRNNFNWITLVSYAAQKDVDSPEVVYSRGDSLRAMRRDSHWTNQIKLAQAHGFKVFLKPHIWLTAPSDDKWRSDIFPSNEETWQKWQEDYRRFILHYAKMAEKNKVELFCIGTEFTRLTLEKVDFWKSLIQEVRTVYTGEITYAANWYEEYEKVTFWEELDYIGIQAYFPLVKNEYPSTEQISKGWNRYLSSIEAIHKKYNRKILFTEMGYKSTSDSAIEPWQWVEHSITPTKSYSPETQANCYQAFFDTVWKKEWFAGVHLWQMRSDYNSNEEKENMDFTPQGKQAEGIIAREFE